MADYQYAFDTQLFDLSAYKAQPGTDEGNSHIVVDGPEPINYMAADFATADKAGPDPAALGNQYRGGLFSLSALNNSFQLVSGGTIGWPDSDVETVYYGRVTTVAFNISSVPDISPTVPYSQNDASAAHSLDQIQWCIDPVRGKIKTGLSGKTGVKIGGCYLPTGKAGNAGGTADAEPFALITDQGFTVLYRATTGATTIAPFASGWNLATSPNMRRKVQMGMI